MYYSTLAQTGRANQFDLFIESTLMVLDNQAVAANLGWMSLQDIRSSLETAVLPNVRSGKIHFPKDQKRTDSVAIMPLDVVYGSEMEALIDVSKDCNRYIQSYPADLEYSTRYDYRFKSSLCSSNKGAGVNVAGAKNAQAINRGRLALTSSSWIEGHKEFTRTRPWITIHPNLYAYSKEYIGAIGVHETIHCQDTIEEGPLMLNALYLAASELRAYHAMSVILDCYGLEDNATTAIESARQEDAATHNGFVPRKKLHKWLSENGHLG